MGGRFYYIITEHRESCDDLKEFECHVSRTDNKGSTLLLKQLWNLSGVRGIKFRAINAGICLTKFP
jgi:hypothetical protein